MNDDKVSQVNIAAYYLAQKGYTYDKLCWMLAERQLLVQRDPKYNQEDNDYKKENCSEKVKQFLRMFLEIG